jgi:mRNA-degrading endonuclease RelE of RelBE toxin-antitoxin system
MNMLYRIYVHEKLFKEWKDLEKEVGVYLLSSTVQNNMYATTEELNKSFSDLHIILTELSLKYTKEFLGKIEALRNRTVSYINLLNITPLTQEEFKEWRLHCTFFVGQWEGNSEEQEMRSGQPVLTFCNHLDNTCKTEGNCTLKDCPLTK